MQETCHSGQSLDLTGLETPRLLLDIDRLQRNADRMRRRCAELGVQLRPHLKTSKSLPVAQIAIEFGPIAVSTLKEAEYFAENGYRDILYAVAIAPNKVSRVGQIQEKTGTRILLVVDHIEAAQAIGRRARDMDESFGCLIEVDCGEHRSGVLPLAETIIPIARALTESRAVTVEGVISHAGHSYTSGEPPVIKEIAEAERKSAAIAAQILREANFACPIVSVGSTPTVLFAEHLNDVTQVRCGIYLFWDLAQFSRNVCELEDIAVSVLASVIGHNRQGSSIIIDAGALALSKDLSANAYLPDAKHGFVCDPITLRRLGSLSVDVVHQEHGTIKVPGGEWFDYLPIGSLVRILPNHTCLTCAAYEGYELVRQDKYIDYWPRCNGW